MSLHAPTLQPSTSTSSTSSWTQQSRNPVSLRLYKVLGTSFDDNATREALDTLSELYGDGKAKKSLKRDMETKLTDGSREFLKALTEIDEKLGELQTHVEAMKASCDDAEKHLALTNEASKTLLERAGSLREERQHVETKKSIVNLFLARFTLTEQEVEAMTSRDVPVGKTFFAAMDKTERIQDDCRVLMSGEDGPTKAGLDILTKTSSYLESAYTKILRFCTYQFQSSSSKQQDTVSPTTRECIKRLRTRSELLSEALSVLSSARQQSLLNAFIHALTRGAPRPIELHAHDPMRYVGDMLAWVHQAIAAEREFLESLFSVPTDNRMVGSVRKERSESEEEGWMRELMDVGVSKLCVPLRVRVEQTVRSQESVIVRYRVANLLGFYLDTMKRTVGAEAVLSRTLKELTDVAYKSFYDAIEAQGKALLRVPVELDDPTLSPPIPLLDHLQVLREIMSVYKSSLDGEEDEEGGDGFGKVLDLMVNPALEMCRGNEEEESWERQVFVLNCFGYILSVLEPFSSFTERKQKEVQEEIERRVDVLTEQHSQNILIDSGLSGIANTLQSWDRSEPLSRLTPTLPETLHHFSSWLSTDEVVSSRSLARLTLPSSSHRIQSRALEKVARVYGELCEEVRRKENRYEAGATLLGSERPFGQMEVLEQIFGVGVGERA